MRLSRRTVTLFLCSCILALVTACAPEGQRERGGDAGGDIGNRSDPVNMHGEQDPVDRIFYQTPRSGMGIERSQDAQTDDSES